MKRLFHALVAACIAFVLAPIVVVVVASFSAREIPEFPPTHWSLRWYDHALSQSIFTVSALNSLWLAVAATLIATPIALGASLALARRQFRGRHLLQTVLLAPIFVPAVVISLALLLSSAKLGLRSVTLRLVGAHVLITFPYMVRTIIASLSRVSPMLEEAAATLGASPAWRFWHVTLPSIRPGVIAGMLFAFIVSFDNVSVSLFLTTARTNTLPLAIMNYVEYNFDPSIAALSTMLVALSAFAAVVLERTVGLRAVVAD
jgi:putative spermidine/putrescine transport system permease protein